MQLIEKYIYAVIKHLPDEIRHDVGEELRTNIDAMLPDSATETDVREALEKLGNPRNLADEYNPKKRYLIGPGLYDKYISILKLVIGICILVFVGITFVAWAVNLSENSIQPNDFVGLSVDLTATIMNGVLQGAVWVTIVFVVLERSGVDEGRFIGSGKQWSLDDLPELPNKKRIISRGETVFSMFATILFTSLLYFQPALIALYLKDSNGIMYKFSLFEINRLESYMIFILVLAIMQLCMFIWKFISGNWSIPMAIGNAIYNVVACILMIFMVNDHSLFNKDFVAKISEIIQKSPKDNMGPWLNNSILVFSIIFIAICIWDSVSAFIKCRKINGLL